MPVLGQLRQGRLVSGRLFNYRYNTDDKTIVAALAGSPHLDLDREAAARILAAAGIETGRRGEELTREEYVAMARAFSLSSRVKRSDPADDSDGNM